MGLTKMKNIIKKTIVFIFLFTLLLAPSTLVLAGNKASEGLDTAANTGFGGTPEITTVPGFIGRMIGIALSFLGLAFFMLMLWGGFLWMFARGNETQVTKAKDLISNAVVGLIIVLSAYAITMFVGGLLTSPSSTNPAATSPAATTVN